MEKINEKLVADLLLTKAMSDYAGKEERFESLNDVIDEVFADGALDRVDYLHNVMELTQYGYINSDLENEEDIELSEAIGFDIVGITEQGMEAIRELLNEKTTGEKVKEFFLKFDEVCGKVADSGIGKLAGTLLLPILGIV